MSSPEDHACPKCPANKMGRARGWENIIIHHCKGTKLCIISNRPGTRRSRACTTKRARGGRRTQLFIISKEHNYSSLFQRNIIIHQRLHYEARSEKRWFEEEGGRAEGGGLRGEEEDQVAKAVAEKGRGASEGCIYKEQVRTREHGECVWGGGDMEGIGEGHT